VVPRVPVVTAETRLPVFSAVSAVMAVLRALRATVGPVASAITVRIR
jgi:hypothetical protein